MQTFLSYSIFFICPALLGFIIFLRYRLNAAHRMLRRFADERIKIAELSKKKNGQKITQAYSIESLQLLSDKIYEINIEQLSARINLTALSNMLTLLERDHNSKIIYYAFLIETISILENCNIQLADVLDRFSTTSPDECVN